MPVATSLPRTERPVAFDRSVASDRSGQSDRCGRCDPSVSHVDLLDSMRRLRRAAVGGDRDAVREALRSLHAALTQHMRDEQEAFVHLPPVTQLVVVRGQQRLLDLIDALTGSPAVDVECRIRIAELTRRLTRQARLESGLLTSRPAPPAT